ncbi:hypothetical protein C068_02301 [Brucella sp. UK38/05]|nr:hypothetical protein C068_02301 [Brucella sp. UK38/05]
MAVHNTTGKKGGKLRLRPADRIDSRAVDEDFCLRHGPQNPVDQIIRAIGAIRNAVAIEIKGGIVAPVIAAPIDRPVEIARADIFHLIAVVDEGIAAHGIAFRTRREMNADAAIWRYR